MKNCVTIAALSIVYFLSLLCEEEFPFFVLVGVPIIVGVLGYKLVEGRPLIKRLLASLIPVLSLPGIAVFLELEVYASVVLVHAFLIGLIIVQLWEALEGGYSLIKKKIFNAKG